MKLLINFTKSSDLHKAIYYDFRLWESFQQCNLNNTSRNCHNL